MRGRRRVLVGATGAVVLTGILAGCDVRPPAPPWKIDLASVNAAGTDGGSPAGTFDHTGFFDPIFSPDGTKVLFTSPANDLGPRDTHSHPQPESFGDVYMPDLVAGTTRLISVDVAGTDSGDQPSEEPQWAGNDKVVFYSFADDLVPHDTNNTGDLFVRDLTAGTTSLVSANTAGTDSGRNLTVSFFGVSRDGTHVAFSSLAPDLVPVTPTAPSTSSSATS